MIESRIERSRRIIVDETPISIKYNSSIKRMMGLDAATKAVDAYIDLASQHIRIEIAPPVLRVILSFAGVLILGHILVERFFRWGAKEAEQRLSEGAKSGIYGIFFFAALITVPIFTYFDVILGGIAAAFTLAIFPYYYGANIRRRVEQRAEKGAETRVQTVQAIPAAAKGSQVPPQAKPAETAQAVSEKRGETKAKGKKQRNGQKVHIPKPKIPHPPKINIGKYVERAVAAAGGALGALKKIRLPRPKSQPKLHGPAKKNVHPPQRKAIDAYKSPENVRKVEEGEETRRVEKHREKHTFFRAPLAGRVTKMPKNSPKNEEAQKERESKKNAGGDGKMSIFDMIFKRKKEGKKREPPRIKIEEITPESVVTVKEEKLRPKPRFPNIMKKSVEEIHGEKIEKKPEEKPLEEPVPKERETPQPQMAKQKEEVPEEVVIFRETINMLEKKYIKQGVGAKGTKPEDQSKKVIPESDRGPAKKEAIGSIFSRIVGEKKGERRTEKPEQGEPASAQKYNKTTYERIKSALKDLIFREEKQKRGRVTWREVREIRKLAEEKTKGYHDRIVEEAIKLGDRPRKEDIEAAARRILGLSEGKRKESGAKSISKKEHGRHHRQKDQEESEEPEEDMEDFASLLGTGEETGDEEDDLGSLLGGEGEDEDLGSLDLGGEGEDLESLLK